MEKLRDEILLAESTRSDLLKWRLALVGAIGAAGYGAYQLIVLDSTYGVPFIVSGVLGGLVAALGNHVYQRRCRALAGVGPPENSGRA
jgi:hypothetical protein